METSFSQEDEASKMPTNDVEVAPLEQSEIQTHILDIQLSPEEQLSIEESQYPEHVELINDLKEMLSERLYHELSLKLMDYLHATTKNAFEKMIFFHKVVFPMKSKIGLVAYVNLLRNAVGEAEAKDALEFLHLSEDVVQGSVDAHLIFLSTKAFHLVRQEKHKEAETLLEDVKRLMDEVIDLEFAVHSCYHRAMAALYHGWKKFDDFCKNALLFLSYTSKTEIPDAERVSFALELAVGALIAENMYDFGDLLQLPIMLEDLKSSEHGWIIEFLSAFDEGRLDLYNAILEKHQTEMKNLGLLSYLPSLNLKVTLFALVDYAFRTPKRQRKISFLEIADHCYSPADEVESLLIKALSLKLIRGDIDEVNQLVRITWVKPRILDSSRLSLMRQRMNLWAQSAKELLSHVTELTEELLIS